MPRGFDNPLFTGEMRERAELTLSATLRALLVVLPVLLLASLLGPSSHAESAMLALALPYTAALYFLQRRGHFAFCVYAVVYGLIVLGAVIAALYGSVRSVGIVGQIAAITVGGIFLGRHGLMVAVGLSVGSIGALIYAENAGLLPEPNYSVTAAHWVIYSMIIASVALVLSYMRSLLLGLVGRLGSELAQREKAEAGKRQSDESFEKAFHASQEAIAVSRLSDKRIVTVNHRMEELYGAPASEIVGKNTAELDLWADGDAMRRQLIDRLEKDGSIGETELTIRTRGGETRICSYSAEIIELGGEAHVIAFLRDITGQRRAEASERQAIERFSAAFLNTPDGIVITRVRDGKVVAVNNGWLSNNGYAREAVVGRSFAELGIWGAEERAAYVERVQRDGRVSNYLATLRHADGSVRQTLLSAVKIEMDGEPCIMSLGRDITEQRRAEEAKRQALQRFQMVFDHSPDSISISRVRDGEILAVNDAWVRLNGFSREQVVGRKALAIGQWMPGDREAVMAQVRSEGRVVNRLTTFKRLDGTFRQSLISVTHINVDGEQCTLFMGRDVTDQQRAEEELRGNRRLLENVIDAIPMSIFAKDLDSNYIMLNKGMAEYFGVSKEELLRRHTSHLPAPGAARTKSLADDAWVFQNQRPLDQPDQLLERSDGTVMQYHSTKIPLFDEAGKLMGLLGINRDISEEKRAREALRNSEKVLENIAKSVSSQTGEEFFRSLVLALGAQLPADTVFIGELVGDVMRTIACCSDGELVENFDYPLPGSPCLQAIARRGTLIHPDNAARTFPEDKVLARRGIEGYAGTSLFDASGKAVGILVALTRKPIERKEFAVSMLEIFAARAAAEIERASADAKVRELNISLERRVRERTAELETANRDLDSFGYSVSHDLRSPLGALNGFAHLLRTREADRLSADGAHLLRQLETNATRMTNLVEGLLEFSRLGRKPVTRIPIPMAALVSDIVEELGAENRDRKFDFRVGTVAEAYGDPVLLRQVWRNLIGNAVKYSRGRDPAVIEIGMEPGSGEYFVRDNGAGFDMQYAERLFGVFERLHSESEFEGTGIGLAIVQRVVNRHGGKVRGEGRPGHGATFRFTLPAR